MNTLESNIIFIKPNLCDLCNRSDVGVRNDDNIFNASSFFTPASDPPQRWNRQCLCLFTKLPDKYLVSGIFPFLDIASLVSCSQTCSRWRALSSDVSLYKFMKVHSLQTNDAEAKAFKVISLRRLVEHVETLNVQKDGRLSSSTFSARLSRLSALSFMGRKSKTSPEDVTDFVIAHPTLRRLVLDGVTTLRDSHLQKMIKGLEGGLRELSVNQCRGLTDDFLMYLSSSQTANTLEILSLEGCAGISSSSLCTFLQTGSGKNLRRLYARGVKGMGDNLMKILSTNCPILEEVDLSCETPFGDETAIISDGGVSIFASALGNTIRVFRIQGHTMITDIGLANAISQLPRLEILDVRGCRHVGDQTASALANFCTSRIQEVRFFGTSLTDIGLVKLESILCRIGSVLPEIIDLFGCKKLTYEGVRIFLQTLSIASQSNISNMSVRIPTILYVGGIRQLQYTSIKEDLIKVGSGVKIMFQ